MGRPQTPTGPWEKSQARAFSVRELPQRQGRPSQWGHGGRAPITGGGVHKEDLAPPGQRATVHYLQEKLWSFPPTVPDLPRFPIPEVSSVRRCRVDAPKGRRSLPATSTREGSEGCRGGSPGCLKRLEAGWCREERAETQEGGQFVGPPGRVQQGQSCSAATVGLWVGGAAGRCPRTLTELLRSGGLGSGFCFQAQRGAEACPGSHSICVGLGALNTHIWAPSGNPVGVRLGTPQRQAQPPPPHPLRVWPPPCVQLSPKLWALEGGCGGLHPAPPTPSTDVALPRTKIYLFLELVRMSIPEEENQSVISEHGRFSNWENKKFYTPWESQRGGSMAQRASSTSSSGRPPPLRAASLCLVCSLSCRGCDPWGARWSVSKPPCWGPLPGPVLWPAARG